MNVRCFTALAALHAAAGLGFAGAPAVGASLGERETNVWPSSVRYADAPSQSQVWSGAGPFLFRKPAADSEGNTASGFRPFWVRLTSPEGRFRAGYVLYPLFSYTVDEDTYKWSLFELVRRWDRRAGAAAPRSIFDQRGEFEVFPFWFSRQSGDPEMSYRGLFPIYGTVKNKLGFERLSWTLFPLYVENEKRGAVTTSTPWPFVRVTRGAAHGWGLWPIFNYIDRPGVSRYETYLWPFGYNSIRYPSADDPPGTPPRRDVGVLPFYTKSTGPGYINEDYLWPFFGYTDANTKPRGGILGLMKPSATENQTVHYHETRYFWPFLVQGRGDERFVDRWAPFYTHSISKGYDKHWFLWPLVRDAKWEDEGVDRHRTQFLYFLYWHEQQKPAGHAQAPSAELTHVWPLFSDWDNGAGRRQWQIFSPLDVFFPGNEKIRHAWSPLFAIARHERWAPGEARTSLLWNAVTWEKHAAEERREFHVGPLLGVTQQAEEKRIAIGNGLFGFQHAAGRGWRMFWWDFDRKRLVRNSATGNSVAQSDSGATNQDASANLTLSR